MTNESGRTPTALAELARLFVRLGTIGFGGPAAHIALMEDEVVRRRGWLTREEFLDYVGATNLIPGPNSTELAITIGHMRAGWPGLMVAGVSFILPAAIIVGVIAWAYTRFGQLPAIVAVMAGVKPVVIAIVVQALWRLTKSAVKSRALAVLGIAASVAAALGANELLVLLGAALASIAAARVDGRQASAVGAPLSALKSASVLGVAAVAPVAASAWPLFAIFLKIGSVLFGSGYVLLAFLRADFVHRLGWLTEQQLLDAVAVGQVTPGPVFTTATFIGYVLAGVPGAIASTVGIFLPAFVFVAISGPLIPKIRQSRVAGAALDGVNVASLALMATVTWQLGRAAIIGVPSAAVAIVSAMLLFTTRINIVWLILGGALVGSLMR